MRLLVIALFVLCVFAQQHRRYYNHYDNYDHDRYNNYDHDRYNNYDHDDYDHDSHDNYDRDRHDNYDRDRDYDNFDRTTEVEQVVDLDLLQPIVQFRQRAVEQPLATQDPATLQLLGASNSLDCGSTRCCCMTPVINIPGTFSPVCIYRSTIAFIGLRSCTSECASNGWASC